MLQILEDAHELFEREGIIAPSDILDRLKERTATETFRESMLNPPMFQADEAELAVREFEDRIQKIKITESKKRALKRGLKTGDIEELNRIPKYIKERWG